MTVQASKPGSIEDSRDMVVMRCSIKMERSSLWRLCPCIQTKCILCTQPGSLKITPSVGPAGSIAVFQKDDEHRDTSALEKESSSFTDGKINKYALLRGHRNRRGLPKPRSYQNKTKNNNQKSTNPPAPSKPKPACTHTTVSPNPKPEEPYGSCCVPKYDQD